MSDQLPGQGKTILITPFDVVLAHVARPLLVARELRTLGYRVVFAGGGSYLSLAQGEGFATLSLPQVDAQAMARTFKSSLMWVNLWTAEFLEQSVEAELRLYQELKPDLVLHDTRPSVALSARVARLPCASVTNAYLTLESIAPWRVLPAHLHPFLEPLRRYLTTRPHNIVRRKYGQRRTRIREMAYDADLVLLADIPEYAPTRRLPANFHYVGPLAWEPAAPWPAELDAFLAGSPTASGGAAARSGGTPVIYFTLGSTGRPEVFRSVIEQLAGAPYRVVITTGGLAKVADLGPLPANFYATTYLPGNEMMRHCAAVVCQAGSGTIYQALGAGVPIVGIPAHGEQWQNVWLMKRHGIGIGLRPDELSKIGQAIERILTTPTYKANAARLQRALAGYGGPATAARLIDGFIRGEVPHAG